MHYTSRCSSARSSVCPSVRSLKYPLSTCTWVPWSIHPITTVFLACPSVCSSVRIGFQAFPEERVGEWPETLHVDVSWQSSELRLWSRSIDFFYLASLLLSETGQIWVYGHFLGNAWGNGLKFRLPIYGDHVQNWLDYNNGLIFCANFGFILTYRSKQVKSMLPKCKRYRPKGYRESLYTFFPRNHKLHENNDD